jgi:Na+-translocating ferredoxin:NAD+ oxidoreductase RnfG subunit
MKRKTTGFLMAAVAAVVAALTSLIVLLRAEKPRRFLQARFEQVRGVLPRSEQTQQIATRVSHLAGDAKGTTEQAMNKVKQTGSDLAEKAKQLTAVGNRDGR